MSEGTVYAVASGKGGVGKTTLAVNLSASLAAAEVETLVIDADFGMANLADYFGITTTAPTVHDVLAGRSDIEAAIRDVDDALAVMSGAIDLGEFAAIDPDGLVDVVDLVRAHYESIILDCGAGLSYETALPLGLADGVVLVTTPTSSSVQDTRKTAALADRMGSPVEGVVVNRTTDHTQMDPTMLADRLGVDHLGTVPESVAIEHSQVAGEPVVWHAPTDPAATAFRSVTEALTGVQVPAPVAAEPAAPPSEPPADEQPKRSWLDRLLGR